MLTLDGLGSVPPIVSTHPIPAIAASAPSATSPRPPKVPIATLARLDEPPWAPARAEPGDMGWDIVYGVKRTMTTGVQPRYNFGTDDEPTSEIPVPSNVRRP
jgi:hypothetical protein